MSTPRPDRGRGGRSGTGPRSAQAPRSGGRPRSRSKVDPARLAAFEVVRGVREEDAYANLLLGPRLHAHGLTGRDASFATELVAGTLRRKGTYEPILAACARRPTSKIDPAVLDVLLLGAHQVLSMRVPSHAAVATSVDLCRAQVGQGPAGFVNAVLRRVAEHPLEDWVRRVAPDPAEDEIGFLAVAQSHPRWVAEALGEALAAGGAGQELAELLAADNAAPRVTLVARPGLAGVPELLDSAQGAGVEGTEGASEQTPYSPYGVVLAGGDPAALPAVAQGRAAVQDEGSQLVTEALLAVAVEGSDSSWLDMCAGPGGKAALLAAHAHQRGAHLLAAERQPHRARLVEKATAAVPPGVVEVVVADGTKPSWTAGTFDRVLLDAPCSGLGALRRRPESRWRRTRADVDGLVELQRALLESALASVRPGGVVAYVTCSPVLAETAEVVAAALDAHPEVRLEDAGAALDRAARTPVPHADGPLPGTVQLWPHRHGTDAMFLALLRRDALS